MSRTVTVNGKERTFPDDATVDDIVAGITGDTGDAGDTTGVAVALDRDIVPRSRWATEVPADGAEIEIITAMQGG